MARNVRGVLWVEGRQTGDGRLIVEGATSWVDPPLPIAWLRDGDQHVDLIEDAPQVGVLETIERAEGGEIRFTGILDDEQDDGAEMVRRMEAGTATFGNRFGLSVDPDDWEMQLVATDADELEEVVVMASGRGPIPSFTAAAGDGDPVDEEDSEVVMEVAADDMIERYTRMRIRGVTALSIGAFAEAFMELADGVAEEAPAEEEPEVEESEEAVAAAARAYAFPTVSHGAIAAALADLVAGPPAEWFADPKLDAPTALTVTDDGRVFGHLAAWGTCHIGRTDMCLEPPPSQASYAHFLTSSTRLSDGSAVPTGRLTCATGHADITLDARAAAAHYDDSGTGWAEVTAGEDGHGIWVAGAVLPDVDELTLRRVQGLSLSGDWRRIGGSLELVAALSVNVPGFPITRTVAASGALTPRVRMAQGGCSALVAAGVVRPVTELDRVYARLDAIESRLAATELVTSPLEAIARDTLRASILS